MTKKDPNKNTPDLSIVVLCYKSGEQTKDFADKIIYHLNKNNILDYEIVLVANYHPDTDDMTPSVAEELTRQNDKIVKISEPKPKGGMMGWDMRSGLEVATGNYIAVIDGDGQMPVEDIIRVYKKIKTENLDLVKTFRIQRGDSYWRKTISAIYNVLFTILFPGLRSRDINSKPKIIRRDKFSLLTLTDNGWCVDAEIMIQARRLKFKIGEIPTTFMGLRGKRKSFVKLPAIFEFIKFLFIHRYKEWFEKI